EDKTVRIWDAATGELRRTLGPLETFARNVVFSSDGRSLIVQLSHSLQSWDLTTGQRTFNEPRLGIRMALSPDGRVLATIGDFALALQDARTGRLIRDLSYPQAMFIGGIAFSPDGRFLAACEEKGIVTLWETAGLSKARILRGHDATITSV